MECNTVGHINDQELSLRIAKYLEPKPVPYEYNDSHGSPGRFSKMGVWIFDGIWDTHYPSCATKQGFSCDCFGEGPLPKSQQPRDMVNDPAMTVMLLKKMCESKWGWELHLTRKIVTIQHMGGRDHKANNLDGQSLGRIIAEAYAKAEGLI